MLDAHVYDCIWCGEPAGTESTVCEPCRIAAAERHRQAALAHRRRGELRPGDVVESVRRRPGHRMRVVEQPVALPICDAPGTVKVAFPRRGQCLLTGWPIEDLQRVGHVPAHAPVTERRLGPGGREELVLVTEWPEETAP
jgi:hypothetical protein